MCRDYNKLDYGPASNDKASLTLAVTNFSSCHQQTQDSGFLAISLHSDLVIQLESSFLSLKIVWKRHNDMCTC